MSALNPVAAGILFLHSSQAHKNIDYRKLQWKGRKTHISELLFSILDA